MNDNQNLLKCKTHTLILAYMYFLTKMRLTEECFITIVIAI